MSHNLLNVNAIKNRIRPIAHRAFVKSRSRFATTEQWMSMKSQRFVLRIGRQFFIAASHQVAGPVLFTHDLVSFYANEWICPHPIDFWPAVENAKRWSGSYAK